MIVYRAAPLNSELRKNDHVTPSLRYAKEHAITSSIYNGEDYGVFVVIVDKGDLKQAENADGSPKPGQFHYVGDGAEFYLRGIVRYDEDMMNAEYTKVALKYSSSNIYNKLSRLKRWFDKNKLIDESNILKVSMPRPFGSLYDIESGERPSEEYGPEKVTSEAVRQKRVECEDRVCWYGNKDRMIRVDVDYIYPIAGNLFYTDLMKTIEDQITNSSELYPARLHCGYGEAKKVNIDTIKEALEYEDYSEYSRNLTTGDKELDKYILDKEGYIAYWKSEYEEDIEEEMEDALKEAVDNKQGDLGKYIYQIRNGNHRAFAAKNAGEKYIWIELSINQYDAMKDDKYGIYEDMAELKNVLKI